LAALGGGDGFSDRRLSGIGPENGPVFEMTVEEFVHTLKGQQQNPQAHRWHVFCRGALSFVKGIRIFVIMRASAWQE